VNDLMVSHPALVPALDSAMQVYDRGTARHSARVAHMAIVTAVDVGLNATDVEAIEWAALLHDVGKLAVPAAILRKPGPLTPDEWVEVSRHPAAGADVLLAISDRLAPLAVAVRAHHEWWDGSGYPDGLAGEEIPLLGRIIALADVYDSVTHPRPYRTQVYPSDAATVLLRAESGAHFDPTIAKAFLALLRAGAFEPPPAA
jgi:putative nucleotidyltransferase with HDIG domain